jgi:hypothetical protein
MDRPTKITFAEMRDMSGLFAEADVRRANRHVIAARAVPRRGPVGHTLEFFVRTSAWFRYAQAKFREGPEAEIANLIRSPRRRGRAASEAP